jgi:hypothetical protein
MSNMKKLAIAKKYLPVALTLAAFATAGTAPALASPIHHRAAQSSPQLFMYASSGPSVPTDAARDAAIHECSVEAGKPGNRDWGTWNPKVYGPCMAEHGQP